MNYAKEAYEAYCRHTGWKSLATGSPLPPWDALPKSIQEAWQVSTAWVVGRLTANGVHEHRLHHEMKLAVLQAQADTAAALERDYLADAGGIAPNWIYAARRNRQIAEEKLTWLGELHAALGWQGGTIHEALSCVRRLVAVSKMVERETDRNDADGDK